MRRKIEFNVSSHSEEQFQSCDATEPVVGSNTVECNDGSVGRYSALAAELDRLDQRMNNYNSKDQNRTDRSTNSLYTKPNLINDISVITLYLVTCS